MAFFRYMIFFQVVFVFADKNTTDMLKRCNVTSMKQDQEIIFSGTKFKRDVPNKNPLWKIVNLICKYKSLEDELIFKALNSIKLACGQDTCVDKKELVNDVNQSKINRVKKTLYNNWFYLESTNS